MDYLFKVLSDSENGKEFRICIKSKTNSFNLMLLQDSNSWIAEVNPEHLQSLGKQFDMEITPYFLSILDYLVNPSAVVNFKLSEDEFSVYRLAGDDIKVKYFSCKLEKVDYNQTTYTLLDTFYSKATETSKILKQINQEKNELANSKQLLEVKLKQYVEAKNLEDQEMYNSFVMILNEKKRRISHLNELLEAFRSGRPRINPPVNINKKRSKKSENKNLISTEVEISDSSSENSTVDNYNTDEDISSKQLGDNLNENMEGVSKSIYDLPSYQSLPKRTRRPQNVDYSLTPSTSVAISSPPKEKCGEIKVDEEDICSPEFISTQEFLDRI